MTVRATLDSRIRIERTTISLADLMAEFTHPNPDYARYAALRKAKVRTGPAPSPTIQTWRTWDCDDLSGPITFPRGGLDRIVRILEENGAKVEVVDRRSDGAKFIGEPLKFDPVDPGYAPMDHQVAMVNAAVRDETCLLRAPTGSGKTDAGFMLAASLNLPTLVLVPTDVIFNQWVKGARALLRIEGDALGIVKGPTRRIRTLTIASVKSFAKIAAEHADTFGLVIADESHLFAAPTLFAAVDPLRARYRVGITADERRKDKKEFLVRDAFGPVAIDVKREELVRAGVIVETEVRLVPTTFEAPWYLKLEGAARASNDAQDRMISEMTADEERNELAASVALQSMRDGPTLAFVHRVEHALRLVQKIAAEAPGQVGLCVGEEPRQRDATIVDIKAGRKRCAVGTYRSIGTGADLPSVENGLCVTPIHTNRPFFGQVRGRVCRRDRSLGATKTGSALYVLWDVKVHGLSPLRAFLAWAKGNVKVLVAGRWEDGREHLRRVEAEREAEEEANEDGAVDALFG